jgi:hypothetical protein
MVVQQEHADAACTSLLQQRRVLGTQDEQPSTKVVAAASTLV